MKRTKKDFWLTLVTTLAAGVLLHDLYKWFSYPLIGLVAPLDESIWEHVKIVFYPILVAGFFQNKESDRQVASAWQLSALISSIFMLVVAYFYHEVLERDSFVFDILLYVVVIMMGNILPSVQYEKLGETRTQTKIRYGTYAMLFLILGISIFRTYS